MPETPKQDNLKLAVGAIVAGCFALSLGDALIKQYSTSFVLWQIFVVRSLITIPFLVYLARIRSCQDPLKPDALAWTLLRSLLLVVMWVFYFAALPHIELAVAAAAFYTLPLFITLFAALFLGEGISTRGWLAIVTGFVGTLLILQPQADDFNAWATLPLVSALLYAGAMILTRSKCRHEKPTVLSLWLNISFVVVGSIALLGLKLWSPDAELVAWNPFLFGPWTPMGLAEWRIMGILAVAIMAGSIGAAVAYQRGPASTVAIFDFSYVGFAAIWGFVIFAELPGALVSAGIILIVSAGIIASRQRSRIF
ncbi:MAG: DMT family transporter [Gammaproteobacteria bacterium]|nr:DMT family transporter [Gammaproteobacteria bacterium]